MIPPLVRERVFADCLLGTSVNHLRRQSFRPPAGHCGFPQPGRTFVSRLARHPPALRKPREAFFYTPFSKLRNARRNAATT